MDTTTWSDRVTDVERFLTSDLLLKLGFRNAISTRTTAPAELAEVAGLGVRAVHQAKQVHGARVLHARGTVEEAWAEEADALYALAADGPRAVGVRVADCTPVLIADEQSGAVAAVHAGWRGVAARIVEATLATMPKSARHAVAIGPCIGPCCFEVGRDVAAQIVEAAGPVIARESADKAWVDLRKAVRMQLRRAGVADDRIEDVGGCTFCEPALHHSFRREKGTNGRHLAAVCTRG
jgi:hypothetical protein